ncbi:MAG: hypothetical protein M3O22_01390 [Pseudomonadota bacterium]|nr:hypothetical protein [Pseudomonadota bacterium]
MSSARLSCFLLLSCLVVFPGNAQAAGQQCPPVAFVGDAVHLDQFADGVKPAPGAALFEARLEGFGGGCSFDTGRVEVDLKLKIVAARGPAMSGDTASFTYFVAITDDQENILIKEEFPTAIKFEDGKSSGETEEELTQIIPLPEGVDPASRRILVGFQLTEDQLAWNRKLLYPGP